ncbi:hypothetical protein [Nocardioides sp.]|uniref:hypothetical protein n=1 Tax=Nocardioides sp. TaxID=35761 RepID=UPI00286E0FA6|nr:hypothetical protein [Nocardioides sp.]
MKETTLDQLLRLYVAVTAPRARDERGDVPGWVMVTVMTVALAIAIFTFAQDPLKALRTRAFDSVR